MSGDQSPTACCTAFTAWCRDDQKNLICPCVAGGWSLAIHFISPCSAFYTRKEQTRSSFFFWEIFNFLFIFWSAKQEVGAITLKDFLLLTGIAWVKSELSVLLLGRWAFADIMILLQEKCCIFVQYCYWLGNNQHKMISLGFLAGIPVILFCCIAQICNMWC